MTAVWPSTLPTLIMTDGYVERARMPKRSFQPDSGPAIEAPKGTIRLQEMSLQTIMNDDQLAIFETFVFYDLGQGSLPFHMKHPRRDEQVKIKIEGDTPYQITPHSPYEWVVSMTALVIG